MLELTVEQVERVENPVLQTLCKCEETACILIKATIFFSFDMNKYSEVYRPMLSAEWMLNSEDFSYSTLP